MPDYTVIPAAELKKIAGTGGRIVDVRTAVEHQTQHLLRPHDHTPLDQLNPADFMLRRGLDRDAPVYFLCRSGMRARTAAENFAAAGYKNVYVIDGGITACEACGEPVSGGNASPTAGSGVISLERQVRIAAGALVALGALSGYALHPAFYLLSFLVGAGLVYAGVTDHCGMALILTKAPWNKNVGATACGLAKPPTPPAAGGCA